MRGDENMFSKIKLEILIIIWVNPLSIMHYPKCFFFIILLITRIVPQATYNSFYRWRKSECNKVRLRTQILILMSFCNTGLYMHMELKTFCLIRQSNSSFVLSTGLLTTSQTSNVFQRMTHYIMR